ncbi:hypothetical protein [Streptomyces avermitilis]|uniref:hypothetical protein n=1 Tax=Streptomyces avermitilis TaxID=33903 RepID=UPI00367E3B53
MLADDAHPERSAHGHPLGHAMQPVAGGGRHTHAVEKDIGHWNPLHADGDVIETGMVVQCPAPSTFIPCPELRPRWNRFANVENNPTNGRVVYNIERWRLRLGQWPAGE